MKIRKLILKNFRTFKHVVLEDLPERMLVFVSPNGRGKSSILEAIAGAHELVSPYYQESYGFHMPFQQRHVPVWPQHLAPPVKIGEQRAEIHLEVEPTDREIEYLGISNTQPTVGSARFVIEEPSYVVETYVDETIKKLFRYHTPKSGVGFIDYIRPVRFYLNRAIGNFASEMSDDQTKTILTEFHHPYNRHDKFSSFKSFVISTQLDDFSRQQATGNLQDSLAPFRTTFDHFFAPKRFVGYQAADGSEPRIVVETPFGNHDTNSLSDGEKEILHQLAHLFRFRTLDNIVLWDSPELHLNAALESRLYDAILRIAPGNQTWIATHSLELINSVPLSSVYVIKHDGPNALVERASGEERKVRVALYQELGAQVGLQLVSSIVVFLEGKHSQSDKRLLDRLVASEVSGVNFVAGGSCEDVLSVGTRANNLLEEACTNGDFLAVVDRDYRSVAEVGTLEERYRGRVFVWGVHEIENLFLDPRVALATLRFLGLRTSTATLETVRDEIKAAAEKLRNWIAGDWVAWDLENKLERPPRRIAGDRPFESLGKYAERLREKVLKFTDPAMLEELRVQKLTLVDAALKSDEWLVLLPGKQVMKHWLQTHYELDSKVYLDAAVGIVLEKSIDIPDVERLKEQLRSTVRGRV